MAALLLKYTFRQINRACVVSLRDNEVCNKCSSIRLKFTNSTSDDIFLEDKFEEEIIRQSKKVPLTKSEQKLKERRFIKHRIIAKQLRKHYREKEPNILTWAARTQIHYLHKKDPIYWTPEMLSQSFPVSTTIIKAILGYDFLPPNEEFVRDYDHEVTMNWLQLAKAKNNLIEGRPVDPQFRPLLESDKMSYIINAAGSKSLPAPDSGHLQMTQRDLAEKRRPQTRGEFSAILDDYEKDKASLKEEKKLKYIEFEDPNYMTLLNDLAKIASEQFQELLKARSSEEFSESNYDDYSSDTGSLMEYQEDSNFTDRYQKFADRYQKFAHDSKSLRYDRKKFKHSSNNEDSNYGQYNHYKNRYSKYAQGSEKDFSNERRSFKPRTEDSFKKKPNFNSKYQRK